MAFKSCNRKFLLSASGLSYNVVKNTPYIIRKLGIKIMRNLFFYRLFLTVFNKRI